MCPVSPLFRYGNDTIEGSAPAALTFYRAMQALQTSCHPAAMWHAEHKQGICTGVRFHRVGLHPADEAPRLKDPVAVTKETAWHNAQRATLHMVNAPFVDTHEAMLCRRCLACTNRSCPATEAGWAAPKAHPFLFITHQHAACGWESSGQAPVLLPSQSRTYQFQRNAHHSGLLMSLRSIICAACLMV